MNLSAATILVLSVAACAPARATSEPPAAASLRLSQAVQVESDTPTLRAYLDVLDAGGAPLPVASPTALTATVGGATATTAAVEPLTESAEGVAYIFLIDISRSLSDAEFDRLRRAIDLWISSLGPADPVALIAFGAASRLEVDFTRDHALARQALARLGPSDNQTVFHRALRDGMELARRRDAGLPGRRVLVVLTDGKDEGSGLAAGDLLAALRADPVPIYAIGLSRLRSESEKRRYLGLLNRLASVSGGAYVEAAGSTMERSYAQMLAAIRRVWVATLVCSDCRLDGESYRLQVNLADGERLLSDGRQIRLLPVAAAAAAAGPAPITPKKEEQTAANATTPSPAPPPLADGAPARGPRRAPWWALLLLLPPLAAAAFWWLRRRRSGLDRDDAGDGDGTGSATAAGQESQAPAAAGAAPLASPVATGKPYETAEGVLTSRPPKPPSLRLVRLIVVRGRRVGRQYSMMLLERGVVGSRSTCDCVLVDEPGVEREQFELLQIDGRVFIHNLARQRETLLDGLPISEREPIASQTLVGNSDCILRLIYDEPRRVPF